jgi:hypothetical protein
MIKLNHLLAPKTFSQRIYHEFSVSPMIVSGGSFAGLIVIISIVNQIAMIYLIAAFLNSVASKSECATIQSSL